MARDGGFRKYLKLIDAAIDAGEQVHDNVKGKSLSEIAKQLRENVEELTKKDTLTDLAASLQGLSPKEIKDALSETYKGLSPAEAKQIADALSGEGKGKALPDVLKKRLKEEHNKKAAAKVEKCRQEQKPQESKPEPKADGKSKLGTGLDVAGKLSGAFFNRKKNKDGDAANKNEKPQQKRKKPDNKPDA